MDFYFTKNEAARWEVQAEWEMEIGANVILLCFILKKLKYFILFGGQKGIAFIHIKVSVFIKISNYCFWNVRSVEHGVLCS